MRPAMVSGFHGKLPIAARATSIENARFGRLLSLNIRVHGQGEISRISPVHLIYAMGTLNGIRPKLYLL
jgi:hypothetical protein